MYRALRLVLGLLISLSFVLMPYGTLHAHVSDHEHTHMHGGHVHDFASDHDAKPLDQVVKISVPAVTPSPAMWNWTDWLPVLCVVAVLGLSLPFVTLLLRPPSRDTEPIPRRSHHRPPLRGPPASVHAI
jgi:hypothetical protein